MRPVVRRILIKNPEDAERFPVPEGGYEVVFYDWESVVTYNKKNTQAAAEPEPPEPEDASLSSRVVYYTREQDRPLIKEHVDNIPWGGLLRIRCGNHNLLKKAQYVVNAAVTDSEKTKDGKILRSQTNGLDLIVSKMCQEDAIKASMPEALPFGANETND